MNFSASRKKLLIFEDLFIFTSNRTHNISPSVFMIIFQKEASSTWDWDDLEIQDYIISQRPRKIYHPPSAWTTPCADRFMLECLVLLLHFQTLINFQDLSRGRLSPPSEIRLTFLIIHSRKAIWTKHWSLKGGTRMFGPDLLMTSTSALFFYRCLYWHFQNVRDCRVTCLCGLSQDRHFNHCHKHIFKCTHDRYNLTLNLIYERKPSYSNSVMSLCIFNASVGGSMLYVTQQDKKQFLWIFISRRLVSEQHDLGKEFP